MTLINGGRDSAHDFCVKLSQCLCSQSKLLQVEKSLQLHMYIASSNVDKSWAKTACALAGDSLLSKNTLCLMFKSHAAICLARAN